jgi:phosphomannomutase
MSQLKITVSGIRGKYPDLINEHVAEQFTNAYAVWNLGKNIVVACDTRHSSPALKKVVIETLIRHGKNVIDIGIVPTPTVQVYIREKKLDGGIMVTASHNPGSDNGLKLISNQGLFLNYAEVDQINQLLSVSSANEVPGSLQEKSDADELHLNKVLQIVDTEKIKSKEFKIASTKLDKNKTIKINDKNTCNLKIKEKTKDLESEIKSKEEDHYLQLSNLDNSKLNISNSSKIELATKKIN